MRLKSQLETSRRQDGVKLTGRLYWTNRTVNVRRLHLIEKGFQTLGDGLMQTVKEGTIGGII